MYWLMAPSSSLSISDSAASTSGLPIICEPPPFGENKVPFYPGPGKPMQVQSRMFSTSKPKAKTKRLPVKRWPALEAATNAARHQTECPASERSMFRRLEYLGQVLLPDHRDAVGAVATRLSGDGQQNEPSAFRFLDVAFSD